MTHYLLDADAIIDLLREMPDSAEFITGLYRGDDTFCTCDIVIAEVYSGLHAKDREQGRELLASMRFLVTTSAASKRAGLWRYEFRKRGIQLTTTDCLITAVAVDRQATLITGNVRDYPMSEVSILPLPRSQRDSG